VCVESPIVRRCVYAALVALLIAIQGGFAFAQQSALKPNWDYELVQPQPVRTGDRIEVVEFFWYGCPHCNNLQPSLEAWLKRKPADVELRRIPAIFRESWVPHARLYFSLEALGEVSRLHQSVYRAIHLERESLMTASATAEWAARNGIDSSRWLAVYNSPEVEKKVEESRALTRAYGIHGTPSLVVDGRYMTSSGMAESMAAVITTLDGLIAMARGERRSGAAR
jgi:protein dithiol oxidoreductase (disulfide-forming)